MLLTGKHPATDHSNELVPSGSARAKLAGASLPCRGACIAKRGDWEWFKMSLGLTGWQSEGRKGKVCWLCDASLYRPETFCYDFTMGGCMGKVNGIDEIFLGRQLQYRALRQSVVDHPRSSDRACSP